MNKFIKVSSIIMICCLISGFLVRFTYGDMIDKKDYESRNVNEVIVEFESRKTVEEGTKIRFKVYNNSKFTYLLTKAKIKFENNIPEENGEYKNSSRLYLGMDIGNKLNADIMFNGIEPNSDGYVEFIVPKGLILDKKYFALDSTKMEYEGNFAEEVPVFTFFKIPVEQNKGVWSVGAVS